METKEKNYSGIVMYTIHEGGEKLRNYIQDSLKKEFNGKALDQSTYCISIGCENISKVKIRLHEICSNAVKYNDGKDYISGDFVTLYHPIETVINGSKECRIGRIEIINI